MMTLFSFLSALFNKVFRLKVSVHTEVPQSAPNEMPAFVPAAPSPIKAAHDYPTKRRLPGSLQYHHVGPVTLIYCGNRHRFREVTRAIDKIANAKHSGIDHKRQVRERKVIVMKEDLHLINRAIDGASYHELRATA